MAERSDDEREHRKRKVFELDEQGFTQQKIADELGIGVGTVNRILNSKD